MKTTLKSIIFSVKPIVFGDILEIFWRYFGDILEERTADHLPKVGLKLAA